MNSAFLRRRTAVAGIGATTYAKNSGRSVLHLAVEATLNAVTDSGLTPREIDGIVTFGVNDTVLPRAVATAIGLPESPRRWRILYLVHSHRGYGGSLRSGE
jgi:acetyl-CoA acetyltransferase